MGKHRTALEIMLDTQVENTLNSLESLRHQKTWTTDQYKDLAESVELLLRHRKRLKSD